LYEVTRITVVIIILDEHFTFLVEITGKLFVYSEIIGKLSCVFDLSRKGCAPLLL
jgi:predicted cation transporter